MTKLVLIEGNKAYRYDGRKRIEEADISWEDQTIASMKAVIEDFRVNGLPPPVIKPVDEAFHRVKVELTTKRPVEGLSLEELLDLVSRVKKDVVLVDGYRVDNIFAELERRGLLFQRP